MPIKWRLRSVCNSRATWLGWCLTGILVASIAPYAGAESNGTAESGLVNNSPFLPPGWSQRNRPQPSPEPPPAPRRDLTQELEFRGVFTMGGETSFSVYDKSAQTSRWLRASDSTEKFTVERYNPSTRTLSIRVDGQIQELNLSTADDAPMPIAGVSDGARQPPRPPGSPPGEPPTTRPPPPPGSGEGSRPTVPRRRVIRPEGDSSDSEAQTQGGSGSTRSTASSRSRGQPPAGDLSQREGSQPPRDSGQTRSAPDFVPPPPPDFVPPPPPR